MTLLPLLLQIAFALPASAQIAVPQLKSMSPALQVQSHPQGAELSKIYLAALENLDGQFSLASDGTIYVSTGDIHAEWLRDSSVQTRPFVLFAKSNPAAAELVKGVVLRQARSMTRDPYANAFYADYSVHERKYELDSLINPILLSWTYWKETGDPLIFTADVWAGFQVALKTLQIEQDHASLSTYTHPRLTKNPVRNTGMIWSGFRASDDACTYGFNIPENAMAVQALHALSEIATDVFHDSTTSAAASLLEQQVSHAIATYGVARTADGETVYAYEVDGLGHALVMDDANLPNLVSLPDYGFLDRTDPLYLATRNRALSPKNPFYFSGHLLAGIGSPHTPKNMVWPLALIAQAITSNSVADFDTTIGTLIRTNFGTSGLHEAVNIDDAAIFTRADFGWPNAMFVEMALTHWNQFTPLPRVMGRKIAPLSNQWTAQIALDD